MSTATEELPATMTDEYFLQYQHEVARIAAREHKRSTIFEIEDVEQAIWEHVIKRFGDYVGLDEKLTYSRMARAARTWASNQRIEHMYATGSFIYTPKIVAAYLDTCAWQPLEEVPDIDARVDLIEAFELLRKSAPKRAAAVFKRYGMNEGGLMSSAESTALSEGIDAICHRLNSGLRLSAESIDLAISKEN